MDICQLAHDLTYHFIYRFAQYYAFTIVIFGTFFLFQFIRNNLIHLHFHGNLKVLLISYFCLLFYNNCTLILTVGHHLFQPFRAHSICDLIIDTNIYITFHILFTFGLIGPMLFPFCITIERLFALKMTSRYEKIPTRLGPILVIGVLILNISRIIFTYYDVTFDDSYTSFILSPSKASVKFNIMFRALLLINAISFTGNCIVFKKSLILQKKTFGDLSLRYGIEELLFSTKFTITIMFVHLLFVSWYLIAITTIRSYGPNFFATEVNYMAARGVFVAMPTFNFIISFVGKYQLRKLTENQVAKTQNVLDMKVKGNEGANNYEQVIQNLWNQTKT